VPERHLAHVVLIGAMGAGKSTVGRLLAARLHRAFVDNDSLLRDATRSTAAEISTRDGVDALHGWERRLAVEAVTRSEPSVIAAAASLGTSPDALDDVRAHGWVVWLRAEPEVLRARMPESPERPPIGALVAAQADERAAAYRGAADLVVDTGATTPRQAVDAIIAALPAAMDPDGGSAHSAG